MSLRGRTRRRREVGDYLAFLERKVAIAREEMRAHVKNAGEQLARWYEDRSATVFVG